MGTSGAINEPATCLTEILCADVDLFNALDAARCLGTARLVCRALRSFVDSHIQRLVLRPTPNAAQQPNSRLPSLALWPRCTTITVVVTGRAVASGVNAADLLALPFAGLDVIARQRISKLSLTSEVGVPQHFEGAVASLVPQLPCLRELELHELYGMPYDPDEQRQMYGALAALPHLQRLTLPSCRALEGVGALAGRPLRRLQVWEDYRETHNTHLTPGALDGIGRLRHLTHLQFERCLVGEPVRSGRGMDCESLLRMLPPSVQHLSIRCKDHSDLEFCLADGKLVHAIISDLLQPASLGRLARALLACDKAGPVLGRLRLEHVDLTKAGGGQQEPPAGVLDPWDAEALRGLVRRCGRVEVGALHAAGSEAALQLAELLGAPEELHLAAAASGPASVGTQRISLRAVSSPAAPLPPALAAADVAAGVLRSMVGTPPGRLLLLTGPFVSVLSQTPEPLHNWVLCIKKRAASAAAAVGGGAAGGGGAGHGRGLAAYQVLPGAAAAVVLECDWEAAAPAAVAEALRSVARGASAGALEVAHVRAGVFDFSHAYLSAIGQALQAVWDGGAGGGDECGRLQRLMALWDELGQVPAKVELL